MVRVVGACVTPVSPTQLDVYVAADPGDTVVTLQDVLHEGSTAVRAPSSVPDVLRMCISLSSGLAYLHENNVLHGCLTPYSVHVGPKQTVRIADFGLYPLFAYAGNHLALRRYSAPEVLTDPLRCTRAADVYSLGMIMYEITTSMKCYSSFTEMEVLVHYVVRKKKRPHLGRSLSPDCKTLFKKCWTSDPALRPDARAVKNMCDDLLVDESSDESDDDINEQLRRRRTRHEQVWYISFNTPPPSQKKQFN